MTKRFIKMCEVYKIFADDYCDFSQDAMKAMYEFETFGKGSISIDGFNTSGLNPNGYAVGKKFLNITVSMWMDELKPFINGERNRTHIGWFNTISRIYHDKSFPKWWLDEIFGSFLNSKLKEYKDLGINENELVIKTYKEATF